MTVDQLARALVERRLPAKAEVAEDAAVVQFEGAADLLYVRSRQGRVMRAELSPDGLSDRIINALDAVGYDYIDEDDARWAENFA